MTDTTSLQDFEDRRWRSQDQAATWRHRVALELVVDEPVLDIGGGDGLLLSLLRERRGFRQLNLLDISPVAVEKAKAKGFEASVGDITRTFPFADKTFGTACALDVLEHLHDPAVTLREMARVAKTVVVVVPNFQYWKDRVRVVGGRVPFSCRPRRGHVYWFNYQTLTEMLSRENLIVERFVVGSFRVMDPLGAWLARSRPALFAHSFAVKLRLKDATERQADNHHRAGQLRGVCREPMM